MTREQKLIALIYKIEECKTIEEARILINQYRLKEYENSL